MKASCSVALATIGKATAATVVMGLCMALVPLASVALVPVLPLPAAHVVARRGVLPGVAVTIVSTGLVFAALGIGVAALVFLIVLGLGMTLGVAVRRKWKFGTTLVATAGAAVAGLSLWGLSVWLAFGLDVARVRESVDASITQAADLYTRVGVSAHTVDSLSEQLRQIARVVPYLTPGLIGMGAVLLAACSLALAYLLFPRVRAKVVLGFALSEFRMHWAAAYASIFGLALLMLSRGRAEWHTVALYSGLNVLLVSQTLFFLQGLAVARWFMVSRQLRPGSRAALYVGALLGQALLQITGLAGLLDTWVDYRKRFALKSPGTGSAG